MNSLLEVTYSLTEITPAKCYSGRIILGASPDQLPIRARVEFPNGMPSYSTKRELKEGDTEEVFGQKQPKDIGKLVKQAMDTCHLDLVSDGRPLLYSEEIGTHWRNILYTGSVFCANQPKISLTDYFRRYPNQLEKIAKQVVNHTGGGGGMGLIIPRTLDATFDIESTLFHEWYLEQLELFRD